MRSTSVETDEPLCLAALLNLDESKVTKIVRAPHQDRMWTFWGVLDEVPRSLTFENDKKLKKEGYRWAPRSFLGSLQSFQFPFDEPAKRTDSGVRFKAAGLLWTMGRGLIGSSFHLVDENNMIYRILCDLDMLDRTSVRDVSSLSSPSELQDSEMFLREGPYEKTADLYELCGAQIVCLLLYDDLRPQLGMGLPSAVVHGILGMVEMLFNGVLHVKQLCRATCSYLRPGVDDDILGDIPSVPIQLPSRTDDEPGSIELPAGVAIDTCGILRVAGAKVFGRGQDWCLN
jgi:hypothetical protein